MKYTLYILAFGSALLLAGCSEPSKPLDSGTAVSGVIWQHTATAAQNSGSAIPAGSRVDVYDRLIIVYLADGSRQIVPLDYITDLKLK